jgi:hypothetical protein
VPCWVSSPARPQPRGRFAPALHLFKIPTSFVTDSALSSGTSCRRTKCSSRTNNASVSSAARETLTQSPLRPSVLSVLRFWSRGEHGESGFGCGHRGALCHKTDFLSLDRRYEIGYNSTVKLSKRPGPCREHYAAMPFFPISSSLFPIPYCVPRPTGNTMRQCYSPPQPTSENGPGGTKSPQIGLPRDGHKVRSWRESAESRSPETLRLVRMESGV